MRASGGAGAGGVRAPSGHLPRRSEGAPISRGRSTTQLAVFGGNRKRGTTCAATRRRRLVLCCVGCGALNALRHRGNLALPLFCFYVPPKIAYSRYLPELLFPST